MRVVGRLRNENAGTALDEVVTSNIRHDLGTREDLGMELLLDLLELLSWLSAMDVKSSKVVIDTYRFVIVHLHLGRECDGL